MLKLFAVVVFAAAAVAVIDGRVVHAAVIPHGDFA